MSRLFFVIALILLIVAIPVAAQDGDLRQWASRANATSQYGDQRWSAQQATGAPDTDKCGDFPTAWASSSSNSVEALTVYYDVAVYPTQVNIYQTYNPGSITGIELLGAEDEIIPSEQ